MRLLRAYTGKGRGEHQCGRAGSDPFASESYREAGYSMDGTEHHTQRRSENERTAAHSPKIDLQGLVEFACECANGDCERSVRVPLFVYHQILASGNQSLLQAGHHASTSYRTIVSVGLMRIEERV